jgi:RNA polymerase sigma factor (sigma-70 family)
MSRSDDDYAPQKHFTTTTGVTVFVSNRYIPPRAPEPPPAPWRPRKPDAVIVPANRPAEERQAFLDWLYREHREFIEQQLRYHGILPESAKDLRQRVLLILGDRVDESTPPETVRAFARGVVRNEAMKHKQRWRPNVQQGVEPDGETASAPSPETDAARAEQREKLRRYLDMLSPAEAEVIRAIDFDGMTFDEAADALGRKRGTVVTQHARALERLKEMAAASERAAQCLRQCGR